jgi:hypothetical protein
MNSKSTKIIIILICLIINFSNSNLINPTNKQYSKSCLVLNNNRSLKHEIFQCVAKPDEISKQVYRCSCKYKQNENTEIILNEIEITQCLEVHLGMAVKGHNLVYHQWINKEHCFNLCLKTNKKHGDTFDCKSFEHWHTECTYENTFSSTTTDNDQTSNLNITKKIKPCTEYLNLNSNFHIHENKYKRRTKKIDLCVLSNQTIISAGTEFTFNHGVTYYEILCNKLTTNENSGKKYNQKVLNDEYPEIKNKLTTDETARPLVTFNNNYEKCVFNPCLNNSTCLYDKKSRFICLCDERFYGIYCQQVGIENYCNENSMDIFIAKEFAIKLDFKVSDIFINKKENFAGSLESDRKSLCKSNLFNKTHIKFRLPFNECGTKRIVSII